MSKVRKFLLFTALVATCSLQAAEEAPWITVGKRLVHPTRVLAKLNADVAVDSAEFLSVLQGLDLTVVRELRLVPGLVGLEVADTASPKALAVVPADSERLRLELLNRIEDLRETQMFDYVQADYVKQALRNATDAAYVDGTLWGLRNLGDQGGVVGVDISAPAAWDITTGSTNVIVAVIDSGVRYTHQELRKQMWHNPDEIPGNGIDDDANGFVDDVFGINAINMSGNPMDNDDHGTHVAGTIGAAANDGNPHVGVAWQVQIMACKFLGPFGGTSLDAVTCIDYAVAEGAVVLNNSWGGGPFEPALYDSISAARDAGVLFVAASGNDLENNDEIPHYPSNYDLDNVISVAAIDRADQLAVFSNYGATSVDLGAPGVEIFSSVSISDSAYAVFQGTSMAAPHVSGVAALIHAEYPGVSLTEMRERLLRTVVPVAALQGITTTGGRVDAFKALSASADGVLEVSVTPPSGASLLEGSDNDIFVTVTDTFSVTNATVVGTLEDGSQLNFLNDGVPPDVVLLDSIYSATLSVPVGITNLWIDLSVTAPDKEPYTNRVEYIVLPPPANDDFENAEKIPTMGGMVIANNTFATIQPGEPAHAGDPSVSATLWWMWSPANDTPVLVDTTGSSFETVVAVYLGDTLTQLREVAAAQGTGNRTQAYVQFNPSAGVTYKIVVGGSDDDESGTIRLRVQPNGRPDVVGPVVSIIEPPNGITTSSNRVFLAGTAIDPQPDATGVAEVMVTINNDLVGKRALGTTNWTTSFLLREGENTIRATAVDFAQNLSLPVTWTVSYLPIDPSNDLFANALELTGDEGGVTGNNTFASKEFLEPNHASNQGGRSLWYRWTAPSDGQLQLTTTNSLFDTLLAVYTGDHVTSLTHVASNDDVIPGVQTSQITLGVRASTEYRIAVDGYAASSGDLSLGYTFTAESIFGLTVTAGTGGAVEPQGGDYGADSTVVVVATPNPGYQFVRWEGTVESVENPLSLVMDQNHTLTAVFGEFRFTEDFESGGFNPELDYDLNPTGSAVPWSVQSDSVDTGEYAARSGSISGGQSSALVLTAALDAGVGSFAVSASSELTWDELEFSLNGKPLISWSGNVAWDRFYFNVPPGTNVLEWRYSKDITIDVGEDAAFIDNIALPLASETPTESYLQVQAVGTAIDLELYGKPDRLYVIEASSDMVEWVTIGTKVAERGVLKITDPAGNQHSQRFYRAYQPAAP